MAITSEIEWTDATWNPWYGCHKVSPGCAYCYMDRWAKRSGRDPEQVMRAKDSTFYAPLHWKEPKRIFTCSLSDFFIQEADEWRKKAWTVIAESQHHTYLILTKRIERAATDIGWLSSIPWLKTKSNPWPNVWLGVSVENQRQADERIPQLLQIPAARHFVSVEPLLGEITLQAIPVNRDIEFKTQPFKPVNYPCFIDCLRGRQVTNLGIEYSGQQKLDWVIVGGESGGPEHRRLVEAHRYTLATRWRPKPKALQWVRSLRDQCQVAGVPFFFKQWGGPRPDSAGKLLDGREWQDIPGHNEGLA